MKPQDIGNGRTVIKRMENFVNWCAWRYWLRRETSRSVFQSKMCVWGDWPPETMQLAQTIGQTIAEARRRISYDLGVCDPAQPWDRWSAGERDELVRRHRDEPFWTPDLPEPRGTKKPGAYLTETQREVRDWMNERAARMPVIPRGKGLAYLRAIMADRDKFPDHEG